MSYDNGAVKLTAQIRAYLGNIFRAQIRLLGCLCLGESLGTRFACKRVYSVYLCFFIPVPLPLSQFTLIRLFINYITLGGENQCFHDHAH